MWECEQSPAETGLGTAHKFSATGGNDDGSRSKAGGRGAEARAVDFAVLATMRLFSLFRRGFRALHDGGRMRRENRAAPLSLGGSVRKEVAICVWYDNPAVQQAYLNAATCWLRRGYGVTLYYPSGREKAGPLPSELAGKIVMRPIPYHWRFNWLCWQVRKRVSLEQTWRSIYFQWMAFWLSRHDHDIWVAADPPSLAMAARRRRKDAILIYYQKELLCEGDVRTLLERRLKRLEKRHIRAADFVVSFDAVRRQFLLDEYAFLDPKRVLIIPNSALGLPKTARSDLFHRMYDLSPSSCVVLYAGGTTRHHAVHELIASVSAWPAEAVLVLHVFGNPQPLRDQIQRLGLERRVFISTELLPLGAADEVFSAADIGVALYVNETRNLAFAGWSSGKMFQCLRVSVPVISNRTPACVELLERRGCGKCISDIAELPAAIAAVRSRLQWHKSNCLSVYPEFEFERQHNKLTEACERRARRRNQENRECVALRAY